MGVMMKKQHEPRPELALSSVPMGTASLRKAKTID
jgi:hypothetical protein